MPESLNVSGSWNVESFDLFAIHSHLLLTVHQISLDVVNNIWSNSTFIVQKSQIGILKLVIVVNWKPFEKWLIDKKTDILSFIVN